MTQAQKAIRLHPERHAQFMAYADFNDLGPAEALEKLLHDAMRADGTHFKLPSYEVEPTLYKGVPCIAIGSAQRIKLTLQEAKNLANCLLEATRGERFSVLYFPADLGGQDVTLLRKGRGVKLSLGDAEHTLTGSLATDLTHEIIFAIRDAIRMAEENSASMECPND